jgi:hypothetical protein
MSGTTCRLDVSDFALEVVPSTNPQSEEWNVYSILVQRDGVVDTRQQTRWQRLASAVKERRGSGEELLGGAAPIDALLAKLTWAPCNQASLLVDFKYSSSSGGSGSPVGYVSSEVSGANFRKVSPKTNHQVALSVIARHRQDPMMASSAPSPLLPDTSPSAFQVLRSLRSLSSASPLQLASSSSFASPVAEDGRFGHFVCHLSVDPAEVYNSPSGRLEYRFQLRHQDVTRDTLYSHLPGTPRYLSFSITAQREQPQPVRLVRNFHDTCVLLDQFVLDVTSSGRASLEYGFGLFPDTSSGTDKKRLSHYTREFRRPVVAEDGESLLINFSDSHHHQLQKLQQQGDYLDKELSVPTREEPIGPKNPVDVVIVSSDCTAFSDNMVGRRAMATGRFKTDDFGGLCKSSLKCSMALVLLWRDPDQPLQETTMDVSMERVDLARDVMNQEDFPEDGVVRCVTFS